MRASQLTVLLGLAGESSAPPDPYTFSDQIGRAAVKTWVVQSLGAGKPLRQWGHSTPDAVRQISVAAVRRATLIRYPMLEAIDGFIPPGLLDPIPDKERGKAAGQWLVQREASIIAQAMLELSAAGVPVLPVHDSLVVPASAADAAQRALTSAFVQQVGIVPRLTVDSAPQ